MRANASDRQDRVEEAGAGAAVLFGNLDAHHAELEQRRQEGQVERRLLVHLRHLRQNALLREVEHGIEKQPFVVRGCA